MWRHPSLSSTPIFRFRSAPSTHLLNQMHFAAHCHLRITERRSVAGVAKYNIQFPSSQLHHVSIHWWNEDYVEISVKSHLFKCFGKKTVENLNAFLQAKARTEGRGREQTWDMAKLWLYCYSCYVSRLGLGENPENIQFIHFAKLIRALVKRQYNQVQGRTLTTLWEPCTISSPL